MNKQLLQNKKGTGGVMWTVVILLVVGLGIGAYAIFKPTSQGVGTIVDVGACPDSTGVLTVNARSALPTGTDPSSPTITCGVGGDPVKTSVTSGTTAFAVGKDLECLVSKADYLDIKLNSKMECGGLNLDAPMFYSTSDNPALTWYNDDDNAMSDDVSGGSGTNQTDLTAGETFTLVLKIQGTAGESSGDGVLVVEFPASTSANITTATLDGKNSIALPSVHTLQNAGSKSFAFDVDAVEAGVVKELSFQVQLASTKDLAGGVYSDWYAKQWFADDDDTLKYGVEDSDGTAKYENTLDSDFFID